ncbi:hypothetical protein [Natronococcus sp.]|uniref:hypothetical protein n=1 Tax=Natronococcus sp. TaxID=35747 RepID=UPI0025FA9357|nr:hypothetical protein [Natronococcus sp.]
MDRRTLLSAGSTVVAALGAGCSSLIGWNDPPPVQLVGFSLHNADTESSHRFDAEVLQDGEVVHASTHEIRAAREIDGGDQHNYGTLLDCEWGSTKGDYAVRARVDGDDWVTESIPELVEAREVDDDCVLVDATYRPSLRIRLEGACDDGDSDHVCEFAP